MILVVVLDPALALFGVGPVPAESGSSRIDPSRFVCAGRGLHAALALQQLGSAPELLSFAGGPAGAVLAQVLADEGLPADLLPVSGPTACGVRVYSPDERGGTWRELVPPVPALLLADVTDLLQRFASHLPRADVVLLIGDSPSPAADFLFGEMVRLAHGARRAIVVDANAEVLREVEGKGACWVRTTGSTAITVQRELGAIAASPGGAVIVTNGPEATLVRAPGGVDATVLPPVISARPRAGGGAVATAALAQARAEGWDLLPAARFAAAAGAAELVRWMPLAFTRGEVDDFLPLVR